MRPKKAVKKASVGLRTEKKETFSASKIQYPEIVKAAFKFNERIEQLNFHSHSANSIPVKGDLFLVSFFTGAGLLDLGFEKAGFHPVFVNELNSEFLSAYYHSRWKMGISEPYFGSSSESIEFFLKDKKSILDEVMEATRKQGIVGFIGGPPCPDFSVGGKNRGRHGDNGKLTKSYFDLIRKLKPDWFLFENVKGLWSTKRHKAFYDENIRGVLEAGYAVTDHLINAIEYGAPQDRERIISIGFSEETCKKLGIEPGRRMENGRFPWESYKSYSSKMVFNLPWPQQQPFGGNPKKPEKIPAELTVSHWFDLNKVDSHPNSIHCFKPRAGLVRFKEIFEGDDSRKSYKRLHRWRYSPTACYGNNEVHLHPWKARRISAAEAMAIQSLPIEFELPNTMTLSAMFKTIGNGVPYKASYCLAQTIRSFLGDIK